MTPDAPMTPDAQYSRTTSLDRLQILNATEACLREHGYDGTTIRQIAKKLNCAVGSIYRYFTDKRALLTEVTQRRFSPVLDAMGMTNPTHHTTQKNPSHSASLREPSLGEPSLGKPSLVEPSLVEPSLVELVDLYTQIAQSQPEQYRLMFWLSAVGHQENIASSDTQSSSETAGHIPQVVQQIIEGWAQLIGSTQQAQELWALVHGQIMLGCRFSQTQPKTQLTAQSQTESTVSQPSQPVILIDQTGQPKASSAPSELRTLASSHHDDVTLL